MQDRKDIRSKIVALNVKIAGLEAERARLVALDLRLDMLNQIGQDASHFERSADVMLTLAVVRDLLTQERSSLTTQEITYALKHERLDKRNPVTIRSHLRRLRERGFLKFDDETKRWSADLQTS